MSSDPRPDGRLATAEVHDAHATVGQPVDAVQQDLAGRMRAVPRRQAELAARVARAGDAEADRLEKPALHPLTTNGLELFVQRTFAAGTERITGARLEGQRRERADVASERHRFQATLEEEIGGE